MEHWVGVFPRDFAQREFLDRFNQICSFVGEINLVSKKNYQIIHYIFVGAILSWWSCVSDRVPKR